MKMMICVENEWVGYIIGSLSAEGRGRASLMAFVPSSLTSHFSLHHHPLLNFPPLRRQEHELGRRRNVLRRLGRDDEGVFKMPLRAQRQRLSRASRKRRSLLVSRFSRSLSLSLRFAYFSCGTYVPCLVQDFITPLWRRLTDACYIRIVPSFSSCRPLAVAE